MFRRKYAYEELLPVYMYLVFTQRQVFGERGSFSKHIKTLVLKQKR